jgi:hypothetical protein
VRRLLQDEGKLLAFLDRAGQNAEILHKFYSLCGHFKGVTELVRTCSTVIANTHKSVRIAKTFYEKLTRDPETWNKWSALFGTYVKLSEELNSKLLAVSSSDLSVVFAGQPRAAEFWTCISQACTRVGACFCLHGCAGLFQSQPCLYCLQAVWVFTFDDACSVLCRASPARSLLLRLSRPSAKPSAMVRPHCAAHWHRARSSNASSVCRR